MFLIELLSLVCSAPVAIITQAADTSFCQLGCAAEAEEEVERQGEEGVGGEEQGGGKAHTLHVGWEGGMGKYTPSM